MAPEDSQWGECAPEASQEMNSFHNHSSYQGSKFNKQTAEIRFAKLEKII
jgi:hypothetical protein